MFEKRWEELGLTDKDLHRLQEALVSDPKVGAVMRGTGGVRKMRYAFENRGKSASARVIYVNFEIYEKIYLLTAYAKNEQENLTNTERNELKRLIGILERQLEKESCIIKIPK